jgi:hypothetical protein
MRSGTLVRLESYGLGFIQPHEGGDQLVFTFDQILGYGGQRPGEIGLRLGCRLFYRLARERIEEVLIPAEPPPLRSRLRLLFTPGWRT